MFSCYAMREPKLVVNSFIVQGIEGVCNDPIFKVVKESRDVWQMYLDMGKFDLAREFCRDNPANLDKVR